MGKMGRRRESRLQILLLLAENFITFNSFLKCMIFYDVQLIQSSAMTISGSPTKTLFIILLFHLLISNSRIFKLQHQLSSYEGKFNNNNKKTTVENKYYICIHQITVKELLSLQLWCDISIRTFFLNQIFLIIYVRTQPERLPI